MTRLYTVGKLFVSFMHDVLKISEGVWKISKIDSSLVSIFGGSRLSQEHPYAQLAQKVSFRLMDHGISVITGGGPGIMEAANCGGFDKDDPLRGRSFGITVSGLQQEEQNACIDEFIITRYFFTRKWLLTRYSDAFIIFPGGFGTLDELSEILTLMQTNKLKRVPIVLVNKDYWSNVMEWVLVALKEDLLLQEDADLLFVTDDLEEIFDHVHTHCAKKENGTSPQE